MYDQLEDHSRILLGKEVVRIEYGDKGVTVMCNDGTEFECNVVIGADGIHSRTRKEMQRLAEKKSPGLMDRDKNSEFFASSLNISLIKCRHHSRIQLLLWHLLSHPISHPGRLPRNNLHRPLHPPLRLLKRLPAMVLLLQNATALRRRVQYSSLYQIRHVVPSSGVLRVQGI